ncbi:hypothetical protein [Bacillus swezeyi]|uniref:Uncharacterized protein n=1 Tax=Bacillus swezeyi TaxID=1925020 RepID=A0A5M8RNX2_9BACI|nr:hypothetical protein [Bacillus swezeyi]KAA6448676.1 hypothetical protein DX927_19155 [Bacillus swezeyi]KAA6481783.1 hypothetical protein DX928_01165 [Bacillus swezeyi]TYS34989.1 hypothetical protein FZC77_16160 [Bacillus swezeyi]
MNNKYLIYSKMLLTNDIRKFNKQSKLLAILILILSFITVPLIIGSLTGYFIRNLVIINLSFFLFILTVNIDKSILRVMFSFDKKQMAILGIKLDQYILGKDISKFYSSFLSLISFYVGSSIIYYLIHQSLVEISMIAMIGLLSAILGYLLRLHFIRLLILPKLINISSVIGFITNGILILWIFFVLKYNLLFLNINIIPIFSIFLPIIISIIMMLIVLWYKNLRNLSIFNDHLNSKANINTKKSKESRSLLYYELVLLYRNPPVRWSVLFFILSLSAGLLTIILYGFNTDRFSDTGISKEFSFMFSVLFPLVFISIMIQSLVSFDIDGPIMPLNQHKPNFIKNKIRAKTKISVLAHVLFVLIYAAVSNYYLGPDHFIALSIILLMIAVILGLSCITSTILFPYFKWDYIYQVPSTLSKLFLNLIFGLLIGLAIVSTYNKVLYVVIFITLLCLISLLHSINKQMWKNTVNKNYISIKSLFE